jgi:hypothetical protein
MGAPELPQPPSSPPFAHPHTQPTSWVVAEPYEHLRGDTRGMAKKGSGLLLSWLDEGPARHHGPPGRLPHTSRATACRGFGERQKAGLVGRCGGGGVPGATRQGEACPKAWQGNNEEQQALPCPCGPNEPAYRPITSDSVRV